MINRREFLGSAGLGALALTGINPLEARAAKLGKIGVQLYTVRNQMRNDFEGSLRQISEIGYKQVEFAGYYNRTPQQVKEILTRYGLEAPAAHVPIEDWRKDPSKAIDAAKIIGHRYLICPWLAPNERKTIDLYKQHAALFNKAGEACKKVGIQFGYHNHEFEFETLDGQMPFDLLLAETDKNLVKIELDLYWITKGKRDPLAYFRKHPGRFVAFHVKDMDSTPKGEFTEVGRGVIDFKKIFAQRKQAGTDLFIVEQDQTPGSPFESLKISYDYLSKLEF